MSEYHQNASHFLDLLQRDPAIHLESMAHQAQNLTRHFFGNTMQLYVPLYLSNYCSGGCAYCGFAADRKQIRHRLEKDEIVRELTALKRLGFEQILLLTGERCEAADFSYLLQAVELASSMFHDINIETFPMSTSEYCTLVNAGCTGVTIYQETYDHARYEHFHRWGPKRDYSYRYETPERALQAGVANVGMGVLLGLSDPIEDALALYRHVYALQKTYWRSSFSISFPRLRPEAGGFEPPYKVSDLELAKLIFAFRIVLPETNLVLSTRESPQFRDGMAGIGINRMSAGSLTTVGGYGSTKIDEGQFKISDDRDVGEICRMLQEKGLEPVFKNWDSAYRDAIETNYNLFKHTNQKEKLNESARDVSSA
jgi:2-iminoacetate synthase